MASRRHPTSMEKLPDEVLSDIFIRLLAKQVAQMRCICKSWNALVSDPSFVKSHLHRSIHHNDQILLFFQGDFTLKCSQFSAHPSHSPNLELTDFIKLPLNSQLIYARRGRGSVIGSVNGLICFYYKPCFDGYVVYIWNPSLSAILTLPPCPLPSDESTTTYFRFGYDTKTDDYKAVKLTSLFRPPKRPPKMLPQVEVYSMRKGSWEIISSEFPSHVSGIKDQNEVYVDGHDGRLHWLGYSYTDEYYKPKMVVAFDLGAETFHAIPLPGCIRHHDAYVDLCVLAGKVCVITRASDGACEVWVMDEYGVPESWVIRHVFPQFSGYIIPYGFTSHNEFLVKDKVELLDVNPEPDPDHPGLLYGPENRYVLYDPVAAKAKPFEISPNVRGITKIVDYVDSLVWVAPTRR